MEWVKRLSILTLLAAIKRLQQCSKIQVTSRRKSTLFQFQDPRPKARSRSTCFEIFIYDFLALATLKFAEGKEHVQNWKWNENEICISWETRTRNSNISILITANFPISKTEEPKQAQRLRNVVIKFGASEGLSQIHANPSESDITHGFQKIGIIQYFFHCSHKNWTSDLSPVAVIVVSQFKLLCVQTEKKSFSFLFLLGLISSRYRQQISFSKAPKFDEEKKDESRNRETETHFWRRRCL